MAASVQVLCPNGRRQTVKITPNSKLLQVLEEVCKKQGFLPVDDYELKHGRTTIDTSLSFRLTSLPNNAKLELVKAPETRTAVNVTIALQLVDGQRLTAEFPPVTTLWQVIVHWDEAPDSSQRSALGRVSGDLHPVCIYLTEEFVGVSVLKATTLRQLGLTRGRAIIRLVHRDVDASTLEEVNEKLHNDQIKRQKLDEKAEQLSIQRTTDTGSSNQNRQVSSISEETSPMDVELNSETVSSTSMTAPSRCPRHDVVRVEAPQPNKELSIEQQKMVEELAAAIIPQIRTSRDDVRRSARQDVMTSHDVIRRPPPPPAPFKFPDATKGMELYKNEIEDVDPSDYLPCDRHTVVYSLDECMDTSSGGSDVPDSFFDITENDMQSIMKGLKEGVKSQDEQPLMTSAMRQALLEQRMSKYSHVILRIQFSDRLVLQGLFKPRETIHSLEKFVKENLDDKTEKFELYTTPPKTVLKDKSQTLILANLAPAAVIYFGAESNKDGGHLSRDLTRDMHTRLQAENIFSDCILPNNSRSAASSDRLAMTSQVSTSSDVSSDQPSSSRNDRQAAQKKAEGKNVPKWFKVGNR